MSNPKPKSVVITGGNGFAGRYLVAELLKWWPDVRITVWDSRLADMPAGVQGVAVDITKPATYSTMLQELQPDWVIHMAAIAFVGQALKFPELTRAVNVDGARWLMESTRSLSPGSRLFMVSSGDIYGANSAEPLPEMPLSQCRPTNPYAESKWEMEKIIEENFADMALRVRPFSHIGPGQSKDYVVGAFASQIADIEVGKQEPVMKVGNLTAKRDFTDVQDMVRAYRLLMEMGSMGEVYNIGSGRATSIQSILDMLLAASAVKIRVEEDPARMRPSDTPVLYGDTAKVYKTTGWKPEISLEQTVRTILDYWREKARTS